MRKFLFENKKKVNEARELSSPEALAAKEKLSKFAEFFGTGRYVDSVKHFCEKYRVKLEKGYEIIFILMDSFCTVSSPVNGNKPFLYEISNTYKDILDTWHNDFERDSDKVAFNLVDELSDSFVEINSDISAAFEVDNALTDKVKDILLKIERVIINDISWSDETLMFDCTYESFFNEKDNINFRVNVDLETNEVHLTDNSPIGIIDYKTTLDELPNHKLFKQMQDLINIEANLEIGFKKIKNALNKVSTKIVHKIVVPPNYFYDSVKNIPILKIAFKYNDDILGILVEGESEQVKIYDNLMSYSFAAYQCSQDNFLGETTVGNIDNDLVSILP